MVKITQEILERMREMRKSGSTYPEICDTLGVTKERCIAYLKNIKPDPSSIAASTKEWSDAEKQAKGILSRMRFKTIHNLNNLCSFPPCWDYLCEKNGEWWLIDVTINCQKSVASKRSVMAKGYNHAILLKTDSHWKLMRVTMIMENQIKID
jgi:hypothetical protein